MESSPLHVAMARVGVDREQLVLAVGVDAGAWYDGAEPSAYVVAKVATSLADPLVLAPTLPTGPVVDAMARVGVTTIDVVNGAGVHRSVLFSWMLGLREPSPADRRAIAGFLDVEVEVAE